MNVDVSADLYFLLHMLLSCDVDVGCFVHDPAANVFFLGEVGLAALRFLPLLFVCVAFAV